MHQQEKIKSTLTPEEEAEMDAFVAEYDRKIAAGDCIYTNEPFEDFTEARENLRKLGVKPKPWGWWLENRETKTDDGQAKDLEQPYSQPMDQKEEEIQRMTPEMRAEAEAFVAEYDRRIAAGDFIQQDDPVDDFIDVLERCERMGIKAQPWGWWLENKEGKTEEGQA